MEGKCYYCNKDLTNRTAKRHVKTCKERISKQEERMSNGENLKDKFILKLAYHYNPSDYYMYIGIDVDKTLDELDDFIREVWVECCDHLSSFTIAGEVYDKEMGAVDLFWGSDNENCDVELDKVVSLGDLFGYEYDFGSTTVLNIEVIDEYKDLSSFKGIEILARSYSKGKVNSPREGVCGYMINKECEKKYKPIRLYIVK